MKKPRSVGVIIDPVSSCVLLILRHARGLDYSTLPGGKIKPGESPEEACIREVSEETGLEVTLERKILTMINLDRVEHYFLVKSYMGELGLNGPEKFHQTIENSYDPQWIHINRIEEVNLLPVRIRDLCRDSLREKWQFSSREGPKE